MNRDKSLFFSMYESLKVVLQEKLNNIYQVKEIDTKFAHANSCKF
jgi:hypothetical protein